MPPLKEYICYYITSCVQPKKTNRRLMTLSSQYYYSAILTIICCLTFSTVKGQEGKRSFSFKPINEEVFRKGLSDNFNAQSVKTIDTLELKKMMELIDKSYDQHEIDLAERELCESPKCLTSFYGYYPDLNIVVFFIQDDHFENAVFIKDTESFIDTRLNRFNGSFGVMSKSGLWVGLESQGSDNYLQIEICQITDRGTWTITGFDLKTININPDEKEPIFWVNDNTIYLATIEYNDSENEGQKTFYEIKFDY